MTTMETAFAWLGCVGFVAVALWLLLLALDQYRENQERRRAAAEWELRTATRRQLGTQLRQLSHWWSEAPIIQKAIEEIGRNLAERGELEPNEAREAWRAALKR